MRSTCVKPLSLGSPMRMQGARWITRPLSLGFALDSPRLVMRQLRWTEQAIVHLEHIVDHISMTSPIYAEGVVLRIEERLQFSREYPDMGKRVPEYDDVSVRELVVTPYRVFYRPGAEIIEVLAIVHSRQLLPEDMQTSARAG